MPCHKQWNISKCACSETCKTLAVILVFSLFIHFKSTFIWLLENPPLSLKFAETDIPCYYCPLEKSQFNLKKKNLLDHVIVRSALSSSIGMAFLINLGLNKTQYIPWQHHGKSPHNLFALINRSQTGQEKKRTDTMQTTWPSKLSGMWLFPLWTDIHIWKPWSYSCYTLSDTEMEQTEVM